MSSSIPSQMKAIVVRETGAATSSQALHYQTDYPTPKLSKPGYALIKNKFSGINFIDTYHRQGLYPRAVPFVCGQEGGGIIVDIEKDTHDFSIGDTVVYSCFETYAEYTLVPIEKLIKVPNGLSLETALACMVQGLTAHYLVSSAHANLIQKQEWCLIYSVGSGTCQWAAQMAKLRGYKVIGTTSSHKVHQAQLANCDELIVLQEAEGQSYADYEHSHDEIISRVMHITSDQGVKCIIDGVGKSTSEISLNCLATRGIFISFGNASGPVEPFPLLRLTKKSAFVTRPKLLDYTSNKKELLERIDEIFAWVQNGALKIGIDQVFDLRDASLAHQYIESGKTKGKLLLKM